MRIKLLDRILLSIFMVLMIAISLVVLACVWGVVPVANVRATVDYFVTGFWGRVWMITGSLIVLLVSIKLLFMHEPAKRTPQAALIKNGELGTVSITIQALDTLVQKAVHSVPGVRDAISQITVLPQGLSILLRLSFMPDVVIPEITETIQKTVKDFVQAHAGVAILEIRISVDSTAGALSQKSRVE